MKVKDGILTIQDPIPIIYTLTYTQHSPEQIPELTRVAHTFMLISNFHWVVVENESKKVDNRVKEFLKSTGMNYTHLVGKHWSIIHKNGKWLLFSHLPFYLQND